MLHTLVSILRIMISSLVNRFIYYFKRLPLIGKALPDAIYGYGDIKIAATIIASIIKISTQLFYKLFYVVGIIIFPLMISDIEDKKIVFVFFVSILFFMNIIIGSLSKSKILDNSLEKYNCVKLMRMPAKQYILSSMLLYHGGTALALLIAILVVGLFCSIPPLVSIWIAILILFAHIIGEALQLLIFSKLKVIFFDKIYFILPLSLLAGVAAYLPLFLQFDFSEALLFVQTVSNLVLSIPFGIILFILFVLSCVYITKYKNYSVAVHSVINYEKLAMTQNVTQIQNEARFADVKLDEKRDFAKNKISSRIEKKQGYDYLNAMFFQRHKRMILKPIFVCVLAIAALFLVAVVGHLYMPEIVYEALLKVTTSLPMFVFIMYFLSSFGVERACRAMFNNCDISLLHYGFYRKPSVIMQNFRIRLRMVCSLNLMISGTICIGIFILGILTKIPWSPLDQVLFFASIIMCSIFFAVHHLCMYYVLQPFTTEHGVKNPIYNIASTVVYFISFICIYLDGTPSFFAPIVLAATVIYVIGALLLVKKFAPKNFRVK